MYSFEVYILFLYYTEIIYVFFCISTTKIEKNRIFQTDNRFLLKLMLASLILLWRFSSSSEDLSAECVNASLTPPSPGMRSPLKSAGGSVKRRTRTTSATHTSAGDGPVVRSGTRTIYTAGRPPWYNSQGQLKEAFVIGASICRLFTARPHSSQCRAL